MSAYTDIMKKQGKKEPQAIKPTDMQTPQPAGEKKGKKKKGKKK